MFSWFRSKAIPPLPTSAQSANHPFSTPSRYSSANGITRDGITDDHEPYDYEDAGLEVGASGLHGTRGLQSIISKVDYASSTSRASLNGPISSRGNFVGNIEMDETEGTDSNEDKSSKNLDTSVPHTGGSPGTAANTSYPPLPQFSRPSGSSNNYPSLLRTFARLEMILADQSPALLDSLASPLRADNLSFISLLNNISPYSLPKSVVESYAIHNGQDPFSYAASESQGGLFWGLYWMPMEQVEQEWLFWRQLEDAGGGEDVGRRDAFSIKIQDRSERKDVTISHLPDNKSQSTKAETTSLTEESSASILGRPSGQNSKSISSNMSSFPAGWIRPKYSHRGWLPLLTDHCGNYIGVDLDPPSPSDVNGNKVLPKAYGQPGQVIAFGREMDEKVVLFPGDGCGGWGRFLAAFLEDLQINRFATLEGTVDGTREKQAQDTLRKENKVESTFHANVDVYLHLENSAANQHFEDSDGIGSLSYLDGGRYGEESHEGGFGQSRLWIIQPEYQHWMAKHGEGGIIGALAERSRRTWRSMGVGSREPKHHSQRLRPIPTDHNLIGVNSALSISGPGTSAVLHDDDEPQSLHPVLPEMIDSTSLLVLEGEARSAVMNQSAITTERRNSEVEFLLSPPSPQILQHSMSENTAFPVNKSRPAPGPLDYLDGRRLSGKTNRGKASTYPTLLRKERRENPPPPASIVLPTLESIKLDVSKEEAGFNSPDPRNDGYLLRPAKEDDDAILPRPELSISEQTPPKSPPFPHRDVSSNSVALVPPNSGSHLELIDSKLAAQSKHAL